MLAPLEGITERQTEACCKLDCALSNSMISVSSITGRCRLTGAIVWKDPNVVLMQERNKKNTVEKRVALASKRQDRLLQVVVGALSSAMMTVKYR